MIILVLVIVKVFEVFVGIDVLFLCMLGFGVICFVFFLLDSLFIEKVV